MFENNNLKAALPLFCLPFAGAGPSMFSEWGRHSKGVVEVLPLPLPGREKLFEMPPYRTVEEAVLGLFSQARPSLRDRKKVLLFGHSMGAILAYELARKFAEDSNIEVLHLFVSGSPGPSGLRQQKASGLSDDEFLERVSEFTGYRHPALEDLEMRELLLPALRADVELHENYAPCLDQPLEVPITSIRGRDDQLVSREEAETWQTATRSAFEVAEVEGGHMYLVDFPGALLRFIEDTASTHKEICPL